MDVPTWRSQIYSRSTGGGGSFFPLTNILWHRYEVHDGIGWNDTDCNICIRFSTLLFYHMHLPRCADMDINLSDYGHKEIDISEIWDDWLRPHRWISPYDFLDRSVHWDSQDPQKWTALVILKQFLYPVPWCGWYFAWWISCCVLLKGLESIHVLVVHPECLDMTIGLW